MLTIDCKDVVSVKTDLLVYVADQVAAIPTLKNHQFTLSSFDDNEIIDITAVISAIKEFLDSIDEGKNFAVISNNDMINITSISGKVIVNTATQSEHEMFSCTHCGYVTQYEVELNVHMRIHYI
jgi:hypothetical protein